MKSDSKEKTYYLGVTAGIRSVSEVVLEVIDKSLEDGVESKKVIEIIRCLTENTKEQCKEIYRNKDRK